MNDLQKKLAIVGSIAFIVWLFIAIGVALDDPIRTTSYVDIWTLFEKIEYFTKVTIYGDKTLTQIFTFITWLGSFIFFFIYKD
jgi:hypothetical protein